MRGAVAGGFLLVCLFCVCSGAAEAVSLQASEDLVLAIPNQDLGLSPDVTTAPEVRLERNGQVFPLTVLSYVAGADGQVNCDLPSGLQAGHYSLYLLEGGKWKRVHTLVKVLAPVISSVAVTEGSLKSAAHVTLEGLFFSRSPKVFIHCFGPEGFTEPQAVSRSMAVTSTTLDSETGLSQVQVQVPDLATDNPASCVFEVQSPNGSAFINYDVNGPGPSRGKFISATKQNTIDKDEVWDYLLKSIESDPVYRFIKGAVLLTTELRNQEYHYNLDQWNIYYWTLDTAGNYVFASGVVIVPQGITLSPLLSFQHGTMLMKKEAPTLSEGPELGFATTFAAADGYVVSMPDHLGLGQAAYETQMNLTHPYCQAVPLAVPAIDMMDAVKTFLSQYTSIILKNRLFLAGYSEGGYATMALHRELETTPNDLPTVIASANMDGPYSLSKVMLDKLMAKKKFPVLYFAPYLLVAYDRTYDIYGDASLYMKFPYNETVAPLINGYYSEAVVDAQMPKSQQPRDLLLDAVAADLDAYQGPIFTRLLQNDLVPADIPPGAWYPKAPTGVIHGLKDDCVPYGNLTAAQTYFNKLQAPHVKYFTINSWFIDSLPGLYHAAYCPYAMGIAWAWFHDMTP